MSDCQGCLGCGLATDSQGRMYVQVDPTGGVLCDPVDGLHLNVDGFTLTETGGVLRAVTGRVEFSASARWSESTGPSHQRMTVEGTTPMSYGVPYDSGGWLAASPAGQPITVPAQAGAGLYDLSASINWQGSEGVGGASSEHMFGLLVISAALVPGYAGWVPPATPGTGLRSYGYMGQCSSGNRTTGRFSGIPLEVGDQLRVTLIPNHLGIEYGDFQLRKVSV